MATNKNILSLFFVVFLAKSLVADLTCSTSDQWSLSQHKQIKYSYLWTIPNFSQYPYGTREIDSPIFTSSLNNKYSWFVTIYPGESQVYGYLYYTNGPDSTLHISGKISILNSSYKEAEFRTFSGEITKHSYINYGKLIDRDMLLNETSNILQNDALTLYVEVSIEAPVARAVATCDADKYMSINERCTENFERFINHEELSDVTLVIDNKSYYGHKFILSARSAYFAEYFKKYPTESTLTLNDYPEDVMLEVLNFIYVGKLRPTNVSMRDLVQVSQAYRVEGMKIRAEKRLCESIDFDNAIDVLLYADEYDAEDLKTDVIEFIVAHVESFLEMECFTSLEQTHPHFFVDIFKLMMRKVTKSPESLRCRPAKNEF